MTEEKQREYIIDDGMLTQWRVGCIRACAPFNPDSDVCIGCEFDDKNRGGCNFDDDAMQKIFQSRPYDIDAIKAEERGNTIDVIKQYAESHRAYRDNGSLEWTSCIVPDHLDEFLESIRSSLPKNTEVELSCDSQDGG